MTWYEKCFSRAHAESEDIRGIHWEDQEGTLYFISVDAVAISKTGARMSRIVGFPIDFEKTVFDGRWMW
jgi:hypothetical protein